MGPPIELVGRLYGLPSALSSFSSLFPPLSSLPVLQKYVRHSASNSSIGPQKKSVTSIGAVGTSIQFFITNTDGRGRSFFLFGGIVFLLFIVLFLPLFFFFCFLFGCLIVRASVRAALGFPRLASRVDVLLLHGLLELLVILRNALEDQGGSHIAAFGEF